MLESVAEGRASEADVAALVAGQPYLGSLPFDLEEKLRRAVPDAPTEDQAILFSRFYLALGEAQLARGPLATVLRRGPSLRCGRAMLDVVASSGDLDCDDYLVPFVEALPAASDRVRFGLHVAGSYHDHGAEGGTVAWLARVARDVGEERAAALFEQHFASPERDRWLDPDFTLAG